MPDRIEMDVFDVLDQIVFILDRVFHVSGLPDPSPPLAMVTRKHPLFAVTIPQPLPSEPRLDRRPPSGEVKIPRGQSPDRMEMIGQDDNRVEGERSSDSLQPKTVAEKATRRFIRKQRDTACRHDREEEGTSRNLVSSKVRHVARR